MQTQQGNVYSQIATKFTDLDASLAQGLAPKPVTPKATPFLDYAKQKQAEQDDKGVPAGYKTFGGGIWYKTDKSVDGPDQLTLNPYTGQLGEVNAGAAGASKGQTLGNLIDIANKNPLPDVALKATRQGLSNFDRNKQAGLGAARYGVQSAIPGESQTEKVVHAANATGRTTAADMANAWVQGAPDLRVKTPVGYIGTRGVAEMISDPSNLIPGAGVVKYGGKAAAEAAVNAAKMQVKTAGSKAATRLGEVATEARLSEAGGLNVGKQGAKEPWQVTSKDYDSLYSKAGDIVDGRKVSNNIPNMSSIESSVPNHTSLGGIREVPMSSLDTSPPKFYSTTEETRTRQLAERIKTSGTIDPLIVAYDSQGPYILEGGHRFDALKLLGAKSFPAKVVIDEDSLYDAVSEAISKGQPVPPEVLKEYPDLAKTLSTGVQREVDALPIRTSMPTLADVNNTAPLAAKAETARLKGLGQQELSGNIGGMGKRIQDNETPITLYRGVMTGNSGSNYYSLDKEFARNFTQSGLDREIKTIKIEPRQIYRPSVLPEATNEGQLTQAIDEARAKGYKAVYVNEGEGQPASVFIISPEVSPVKPLSSPSGLPPVSKPPVAVGAGMPPVPPTAPVVATVSPAQPVGVTNALAQAKAIVQRDKPGIINRIIDRTLGAKQLQRAVHPSLGMKDNMIEAWVGQGNTRATVSNTLHAELLPVLSRLETAFGKGATEGSKTAAKFIGTVAEEVPFTGTLYDVMQRPQLYDLTTEQRSLLREIQNSKSELFNKYRALYGLDINEFATADGAVHLPNVDVSKTGLATAGDEGAALRRGRAKERFYDTGADRYLHDKALAAQGKLKPEDVFNPNLNIGKLLNADNETLAAMSSQNVFKTGLGGKTKLELIQTTHPELYAKMTALRRRLESLKGTAGRLDEKQQAAIGEFLNSPYTDADLTQLQSDLMPGITRGKNAGKDLAAVNKEIAGVKVQIAALQPSWRTANPRGYVFVQDGGLYSYFTAEDAKQIQRLTQTSKSKLLHTIDEIRATAFGGDLSPATIQGVNAWLADPVGVSKTVGKEVGLAASERKVLRPWLTDTLASDVRANPESWERFTQATGLNPLGMYQREEFGAGLVAKIPKVGKYWEQGNDALYRGLVTLSKDSFDTIYAAGIKAGKTPEMAAAIAADDVTKLIPSYSYRRLGMSQAESAKYRAALTSVSFLTQPAALMTDATKGLVKLGTLRTTTASEQYAMKRVLTLAALVSSISAISGALYAKNNGKDPAKAALAGVTPGDPYFWSLVLPNGSRVGLGGPFRSLLRAVVPGNVEGVPVPMPFAGIYRFAMGKMNPAVGIAWDEARNKDYYGKAIRKGDFPVNILLGVEYAVEGSVPLTVGSAMEDVRRGETKQIPADVASQFAGVNLAPVDKVWNLQREWEKAKDFDAYNSIPSNDIERQTKYNTAKTPEEQAKYRYTRSQYREKNPQVEAKLFITGQVSTVSTVAARYAVLQLIQANKIDPNTIKGIEANKKENDAKSKAGIRDTTITQTDLLVKTLGTLKATTTTTTKPVSNPTWDTIKTVAPLSALNNVWYQGGTLTSQEDVQLKQLFQQYPLGQTDYNVWLKQTLRQFYEKWYDSQVNK